MENLKIYELDRRYADLYDKDDMLAGKNNGKWRKYSCSEYIQTSDSIAYGLINLGLTKNDKICIISNNRPEWSLTDMGINKIGAINTPLYANSTRADYKYIINDSEAKLLFIENEEVYNKIKGLDKEIESLEHIYSFENISNVKSWNEVIELGLINPKKDEVEGIQNSISENDLFTLIYTSGTTGNPKGVMLTHSNILSQLYAIENLLDLGKSDRGISFLPLSHIFERMLEYYYLFKGVSIYYGSIENIGNDLKEIQPTVMPTVPRLLEKVYDKILTKGKNLTGFKKNLFFWALNLGLRHEYNGKNGLWYEFQLKIANALVFKKWREAVGGNVRMIISGSAALQERLARVFTAAKMPVSEGYGLTETSPVISVNLAHSKKPCYGTVGEIISGVQVKINHEDGMREGEGEILVKGPNVMRGYYNKPEETKEVIDKENWFHTGDIGKLVDGKYLKITDRKKEIFKTSGGKYIAPQVMENKFKQSMFIEQIIVIGENEKHPAALIVPDFEILKKWCENHNISFNNNEDIIMKEAVLEKYSLEIDKYNSNFNQYEQVKKFELLSKIWGPDTGELTATLKLKRRNVLEKYKDLYNKIYSN
ncbi:MAG: long-chain fatty acid--CoA ligase [Flavobacteriales bacterium TMED113]|nr:MAG: long-chain fatty acid--CoA ligase [Flavobacteriales bacterium TMED113]